MIYNSTNESAIIIWCLGNIEKIRIWGNDYDEAEKDGLDVSTVGVADMVARDQIAKDQPIVIMIAPQVKYMHARYEEEYGADYPVVDINMMDYGMMKGEAILQAALASERK